MSSKRSRPYDDPPSPQSSEEEVEEEEEQTPIQNPKKPQSDEEEEESSEEEEEGEEQTPIQNPKKPQSDEEEESSEEQTPIQNPKKPQSDEEDEEEEVDEDEEDEKEEVDEEEEVEEEEEEEEETDADLMKKPTNNNNNTKVSQPEPESEAGSESESEAEPQTNYIAKPIVKESPSSKAKNVPKTTSSMEEKSKKAMKAATKPSPKQQGSGGGGDDDEDGGEKKALLARVWSFEDELAVLRGMIDFKKGNGKDPLSNSDEFYNFVKQKISNGKFTKAQVVDKVRRLKKKYLTSVAKSNNGKAVEFSDPHLLKGYKLSEVIWGKNDGDNAANVNSKVKIVKTSNSSNAKKDNSPAATIGVVALPASDNENVGSVVKGGRSAKKPKISDGNRGYEVKNGNVGKVENKVEVEVEGEGGVVVKGFTELYPHLMEVYDGECVSGLDGLKNYLGMVDGAVLEEWNKKWGEIRVAEMDMYVKKLVVIQEQVSFLSNAIKSSQS